MTGVLILWSDKTANAGIIPCASPGGETCHALLAIKAARNNVQIAKQSHLLHDKASTCFSKFRNFSNADTFCRDNLNVRINKLETNHCTFTATVLLSKGKLM